jgi:hypothetical protein
MYPDYEWLPWKFTFTPKGFWSDQQNQRAFIDWVGKQLKYKNKEDWYNISVKVKIIIKFKLKFYKGNCRIRRINFVAVRV